MATIRRTSRASPRTASTAGPGSIFQGSADSSSALAAPMSRHVSSSASCGAQRDQAAVAASRTAAATAASSLPAIAAGADAAALGGDHGGDPRHEVAQVVGQVRVVTGDDALVGEVAVTAEGHVAQQVVAQRVDAEVVGQGQRRHVGDVERRGAFAAGQPRRDHRLAELLPAHQQVAVDEDLGRRLQAGRHAHGGPPDAVELEDVLADQVVGRAPAGLERGGITAVPGHRQVVDERVVPDVEDVPAVPRHRHAPGEGGAGDGHVTQAPPDESEGLVALGASAGRSRGGSS